MQCSLAFRRVRWRSEGSVADDAGALHLADGGPVVHDRVVLGAAVVPDGDAVRPSSASAPGIRGSRPGRSGSSAVARRRARSPGRSARSAGVWKLVKCVVKALTKRTFSPVSGCVRTTGCSASGNCAFSARRFSIGIAAPKVASMLWRARRPAICVLDVLGQAVVGQGHVGPDRVAADRRALDAAQHAPNGGALAPGGVAVPGVLVVLRRARRGPCRCAPGPGWSGSLPATGWSSSSPKPLGEGDVLGAGDVLVAEEQHLVLQQQRLDLGEQLVVARRASAEVASSRRRAVSGA